MLIGLAVYAALALGSTPPTDGACAWLRLPEATRQEYVAAFQSSVQYGSSVLQKHDPEIRAAFNGCAGRNDVPTLWAVGAVTSQAIQAGAAEALTAGGHSVESLDAAWAQAPDAARACTRAHAAKTFGITDEACPDRHAILTLLESVGVTPRSDRRAAMNALYYFNAKAQSEWAAALIAKFKAER